MYIFLWQKITTVYFALYTAITISLIVILLIISFSIYIIIPHFLFDDANVQIIFETTKNFMNYFFENFL